MEEKAMKIEAPIFVLFAEYLGYCSRFLEDCEKWCNGDIPSMYLQRTIMVEAKSILRQMLKDYSREEIIKWYNAYYDPIIKEYEDNLNAIPSEEAAKRIMYEDV